MVCRDAIHDERILAILRGHLDAELNVGALVLVRQDLADVVQQRASARHVHVETELGSHDTSKPRHFLRVLKDVLAVARSPSHATDELHELRMQTVNTCVVRRLLASLDDLRLDFLARFVDDFFDATWMNAAVRDQLLQREARHFTADRVETRHDDRIRRVVDDHVNTSRELERTDVSALASDDASLHLVVGKRNGSDSAFGCVIGRDSLNRQSDDLLGLSLRVTLCRFANLANAIRRICLRLFFHSADELVLRVLRRHSRHLLEPAPLVSDELVELLFAVSN
jgi:hypothetical protein